jgi:ABC-type dipeptide/oligopeptide/nickel transport system permease subunit
MRVVDVVMSIPDIVLAIAIMVVAGPGLINLTIAMASTYWTRWARIVRSRVLSLREEDYVEASKVFGASNLRIISEHILPNVGPSVIVMATLTMSGAILYEAALSFIGFGVPPPAPSWGQMLATARQYMLIAGHLIYFPGIAITLTTLGFYLLGDGLRDALDPKLRID